MGKKIKFILLNEYHQNQAFNFRTTLPSESIKISHPRGFIKAYDNIEVTVISAENSIDPTIQNEEKLLIQSYPTGVAACFFRHANPRDSFSAMDERGAKPAEIFF